jgi:hypothetical protein
MMATEPSFGARDYILGICDEMPVGWHELFEIAIIEAAWPPESNSDDRPVMGGITTVGELRDILLISGGHRPAARKEPAPTPVQCLKSNLGKQYEVHVREQDGTVEVHRIRDRRKENPQTYDLKINADDTVSFVRSRR